MSGQIVDASLVAARTSVMWATGQQLGRDRVAAQRRPQIRRIMIDLPRGRCCSASSDDLGGLRRRLAALQHRRRGDQSAVHEDVNLIGEHVHFDNPLSRRLGNAVKIAADAHRAFMRDASFQLAADLGPPPRPPVYAAPPPPPVYPIFAGAAAAPSAIAIGPIRSSGALETLMSGSLFGGTVGANYQVGP